MDEPGSWRPLTDYAEYSVSDQGEIRRRNRILKPNRNTNGYHYICLSKNGKTQTFSISRLVALTWLPPVEGKPTVDHINRIRTDNRVANLRWASMAEQSLNRDYPLGAVGHRHICRQGKWWKVQIRRDHTFVYTKTFCSLEAAIEARDNFISSYNGSPETPAVAVAPPPSP